MIQVDNKFNIGDICYTYYQKKLERTCPICEGTKKILYNGYEIACRECNKYGKVDAKQTVLDVAKIKVHRINASIWADIVKVKYKVEPVGDMCLNIRNREEDSLFATYEEAAEKCMEMNQGTVDRKF